MSSCRATNANLNGASLIGASLNGADLDGASLTRASLIGANLDGASLIGAAEEVVSVDRFTVRGETAATWHECVRGAATLCGRTIDGRVRHSQGEVGCARCLAVREAIEVKKAGIREMAERLSGPRPPLTPGLANVIDLAEERRRRSKGAA